MLSEEFFKNYPKKDYPKGSVLLDAGEDQRSVYFLVEGTVKVVKSLYEGQELTLNLFKPTSLFPLGPALNNTENEYRYQAMTDVTVYLAPVDQTLQFLRENPEVMFDLIKRIYRGLDGLMELMAQQMTGSARTKLITQLVILAKRLGPSLSLTHTDLADLTGLSRETVTRELDHLSEKGVIKLGKSHLSVENIDQLEAQLNL